MKTLQICLTVLAVCLGTGCSSDYWAIQRSESFISEKNKPKKIICLGPQISFQVSDKNLDAEGMEKLSEKFETCIQRAAGKNDIQLDIQNLDKNANVNYYDKLQYLKQCLIEVNFNNYASVHSRGGGVENMLAKSVYLYAPKISYDFNGYSKLFGTRYFSFVKINISNGFFTFNHVLVDTDLSETVYSERKTINRNFNQDLCNQVVYDSFAALSAELNL